MPPDGTGSTFGGKRKLAALGGLVGVIAVVAAMVVFSSASPSSEQQPDPAAPSEQQPDLPSSAYPNVDPSNSRSVGGPIDASTVAGLKRSWGLPLRAETFSAYWSTPAMAGGVAYSQDSASNVQAIALSDGQVLWETEYASVSAEGPNGVAVADGRVFGTTRTAAFALDQKTGEELWSTTLVHGDSEEVHMTPGYHRGLVYVSTAPSPEKAGGVGTVWALNAATGRKSWKFATVPKDLWGNPRVNSGGGLSQPPAFDGEGGMYVGVGNPNPVAGTEREPWGSSRPGPNLYTGSILKLDAKTGELEWYYQLTPHAICAWGLAAPPMLADVRNQDLVLAAGKSGIVIALDRHSGKLLWKQPVGIHNGHDNDGQRIMRDDYSNVHLPMTVVPGGLGGVVSALATDGSNVFVPVVNSPTTLFGQRAARSTGVKTGEVVALDLATGTARWRHELPDPVYAAPIAVNDLVFVSTAGGQLYAYGTEDGLLAWRTNLPAGAMGGLGAFGDTLLAPAAFPTESRQDTELVAYRLEG
jgi:outer membrane protein assembly factor BamB